MQGGQRRKTRKRLAHEWLLLFSAMAGCIVVTSGCSTVSESVRSLVSREHAEDREASTEALATQAEETDARTSLSSAPSIIDALGATAGPSSSAGTARWTNRGTRRAKVDATLARTEPNPASPTTPSDDAGVSPGSIRLVEFQTPQPELSPAAPAEPETLEESPGYAEPQLPLPASTAPPSDRYPINLGTALQLAGANNLQIALAEERVREALAQLEGAEVLWIPSINAGVGYNNHTGQLQATEGDVIEVNRESVFVGGGGVLSGAPLTGGAGGPARLAVDISPVDIFFEPLAAGQAVAGSQADEAAVFNDTLLRVTAGYLELLDAQSRVAIAEEAVRFAEELLRISEEFVRTGRGLPADAERARTELADRRREVLVAEEQRQVISADLARLLRLRPDVTLLAVDPQPVPLPLFTEDNPLEALIAEGLANRPEVERGDAAVFETLERTRQERLRPWLPNLHLGVSSGGFGGGADSFFGDFSDRTDFDALAVWELRNLGLGNRALIRQRTSQHQQAQLAADQVRDLVAAEVTQAYQQVRYRRRQIEEARTQVESAAAALPLNFEGITAGALRVIEAQQAITALAQARSQYSAAVTQYNQAQFALLRAIGQPARDAAAN